MKKTIDAIEIFARENPAILFKKEYRFHPERKWRFDAYFSNHMNLYVGIEIQGGIFVQGKHARGAGLLKDYEKQNAAACMGILTLQYSPSQPAECYRDLKLIFGGK